MTASNIKPSTATVTAADLRSVRFTALRGLPKGTTAFIEMHDEKGTFRRILSSNLPDGPLKNWNEKAVLRIQGRGEVEFGNHGMKGPEFPVFMRPKTIGDGLTRERASFYIGKDAFASETEKEMAKPAKVKKEKKVAPSVSEESPKRGRGRPKKVVAEA